MRWLYTIGVKGYTLAVRLAALWSPKAKKWVQGRKVVWDQLIQWERHGSPVYWFHCASLGEFEQGRPLIERLKETHDCQIVLTFFSPSGYEIRKGYKKADLVIYLPTESRRTAQRFLEFVRPKMTFFIKYEFWAHYILEAKAMGSKVYSVSAVFHEKQLFFKSYGGFMRKVLAAFDGVFVQDKGSVELLKTIGVEGIHTGDTRYDRVMQNAKGVEPYPEIEAFIDDKKVVVVGSSWKEDDEIISPYLNQLSADWKVIIAPHEIELERIDAIERRFKKKTVCYSRLEGAKAAEFDVLIIDNIGMLMNVYQYATIAYVGGAFGKGLHNILEPACFGVPVIFGANYQKFNEAFDFIEAEIGFSVNSSADFQMIFEKLAVEDHKDKVLQFMNNRVGATQAIMRLIGQ